MKYITTDKHPELKCGIILECISNLNGLYRSKDGWSAMYIGKVELSKGYIKELQEPEFTKDDMLQFCGYLHDKLPTHSKTPKDLFNDWLKQRSK